LASNALLKATIDLDTIRPRLQNKYERTFRLVRDAQRLLLAPHPDADGLSAAALLVSGFRIPDKRYMLVPITTPSRNFSREDVREVFRYRPDIITFLDLSPKNVTQLQLLKRKASLVLIDHHRPVPETLREYLLAINPEPDIGASAGAYPAGKLVYDLLGAAGRPDLALVSILGDQTEEDWRGFLKQFSEEEIELARRVARRLSAIGPATRIDEREARPATLRRQRVLFSYLARTKTLAGFLSSVEATRPLKEVFEQLEEGVQASTGRAQVAIESAVEFVHVPIKPTTKWSVISGVMSRLELVAPGQTVVISEPWARGVELRVMSNDPDIDVVELLEGFGGGHAQLGGGHSDARASEVVDVLRERWAALKRQTE
jgi:hypothetical protein